MRTAGATPVPWSGRETLWLFAPSKYATVSALVASPGLVGANVTTIVHVELPPASDPPHVPPAPGYAPPLNENGADSAVADSAVASDEPR